MNGRKRIDIALVERGFSPSRAKAREAIEAGLVYASGKLVRKPSEEVAEDTLIKAAAPYPWVSRGGVKLAKALDAFSIDPQNQICLDLGASTGGFTQVLLSGGAAQVFAVDVGHGQIHPDVAADPRVIIIEKTDARSLLPTLFSQAPQLVVCDVSFISLKLVLPHALSLCADRASLIALIKPQFEAGPERTQKGIVRDPRIHKEICDHIATFLASLGWRVCGLIPSPIEGGDGNREFLVWAERG